MPVKPRIIKLYLRDIFVFLQIFVLLFTFPGVPEVLAAVNYRASSAVSAVNNAVATISQPTGTKPGDLMILVASGAATTDYLPTTTGWNIISDVQITSTSRAKIAWAIATTTSNTLTLKSVAQSLCGAISSFSGASTTAPIATSTAHTRTTVALQSITATTTSADVVGTLPVFTVATGGNSGSFAWPRQETFPFVQAFSGGTVTGNDCSVHLAYSEKIASSTAIDGRVATYTTAGENVGGMILIRPDVSVSGTLYADEGATKNTATGVSLKLQTSATSTIFATTTGPASSNGYFSFNGLEPFPEGSTIRIWVDSGGTGAVVTKASSTCLSCFYNVATSTFGGIMNGNITGLNLFQNRVIARHEAWYATSTTNTDFGGYDQDNNSNLMFKSNNGSEGLRINSGNMFYIWPGTEFKPGGPVTLHGGSALDTSGSLKLAASTTLPFVTATSSIFSLNGNTLTLAGSFMASSSSLFTSAGTTTFNATTTGKNIYAPNSVPFYNLEFNSAGGAWNILPTTTPTTNGLVGHWSFDTDTMGTTSARDSSTSGNTGWLINGPVKTGGVLDEALDFDGANDYATTSSSVSLAGSRTISFWLNPKSSGAGTWRAIVGSGVNDDAIFLENDNTLSFSLKVIPTNQWTHAVYTWDGATTKVYLNDSFDASTATQFFSIFNTIGTDSYDLLETFEGALDDVRIYNRALSAEEIQNLYLATNITVSKNFQNITGSVTSPRNTLAIGGNFSNTGRIIASLGTTTFNGTTTQNLSGFMVGTSTLNNVVFSGTGAKIFNSNASTTNFFINSGTTTAPSLLTVYGNYFNNHYFTHNSGSVYIASTTAQQVFNGSMASTSAFNNLIVLNNSGTDATTSPSVIFKNVASTTGTFTAIVPSTKIQFPVNATSSVNNLVLNGQAAGTKIMLRGATTTGGTDRFGFDVLGTESISYTDFMDTNACRASGVNLSATDGTNQNSGNNSCIDFTAATSVFTQRNYGWAINDGNLSTGGLRSSINSPITSVRDSEIIRLRMDVGVSGGSLSQGAQLFTLQYAALSGTCAASSYSAVGAAGSGSIWRGYDNASLSDDTTLTSYVLNPSNTLESYEENGSDTTNSVAISAGSFGEWDWSLQNNGATAGTTYCFRMVKDISTAFTGGYTNYPQLTTITSAASIGAAGSVISGDPGTPSSETPRGGGTNLGGGSGSGGGDGGGTPVGGGTNQGGGGGSEVLRPFLRFFAIPDNHWQDIFKLVKIFSFR